MPESGDNPRDSMAKTSMTAHTSAAALAPAASSNSTKAYTVEGLACCTHREHRKTHTPTHPHVHTQSQRSMLRVWNARA